MMGGAQVGPLAGGRAPTAWHSPYRCLRVRRRLLRRCWWAGPGGPVVV